MQPAYADAIVVVTGASTGLGRAIAVGAAERGARAVAINYVSNEDEAARTAQLVTDAGCEAVLVQGSVGEDADCRAIIEAVRPYGRIDTLFNNAGTSRLVSPGDLAGLDADDFLNIYRINVVGPYQMIRAARVLLEAAASPSVVNTSSVAGITGNGSSLAYTASKGALNALTLGLARALAPKIRVNALCPGFIDSPWFDKLGYAGGVDRLREIVASTTPLRAASTPEDIAESALFLGSRAARHITGETLMADAGMHLGSS
jgi:NAD(P)-dependent dehydrogenase (short-subunit alcohol dehydrogenase family)